MVVFSQTLERRCEINTSSSTQDIRYEPLYTIPEVAGYARVDASTLRTWAMGRPHPYKDNQHYPSVIKAADRRRQDKLSFINLIEPHESE